MILVELLSYLIVELKETTLETVNINLVSINIILMISTNEHATTIL